MPSFRRRASVVDAERAEEPQAERPANAAEALALAEEAEAEAAEAEAVAAAARAKARAIRLRRQATTAAESAPDTEAAGSAGTDTEAAGSAGTDTEAAGSAGTDTESVENKTEINAETEPVDAEVDHPIQADDSESAQDQPARRRLRPSIRLRRGAVLKTLAAAVVIACTAALITLSVVMVISHRHQAAESQRRAEFAAAARQSVVTLMSLDFNKAKDDVARIIDNSTGQFHDDFKNQADDFIKVAQDSKVITEVAVNAVGIEQMTDDSATALVSATSRVSNAAGAKQEPRSWRLSVVLQRDGGQIKMSRVEFVP